MNYNSKLFISLTVFLVGACLYIPADVYSIPTISSITSNATTSGTLGVGNAITFTLITDSVETGATVNGTYNTQPLIWSAANNGITYTAIYVVSEGEADQITPLQITSVTITNTTNHTSLPINGTDIAKTIDANSPTITSITSDATTFDTLKVGDTISFTLTPGSAEAGATIIATYNTQSLIWSTANNGNTYTATYTVSEGEPDQIEIIPDSEAPPETIIPLLQITNVTITDSAGNTSFPFNGTDIVKAIDANSPTISTITSDAASNGTLKVGDTISFTLTPGSAEAGATIIATYNAQSLIWSTANNGNTYTATYTVSEGEPDQIVPLQISNVTITDSAGNTSIIQSSGTDILKNIDANSPTITSITSDATTSGTLKVGDTISFTLTPGSAEIGNTVNGTYNTQSLIWSTANNGTTYTATYTVSEGDADQTALQITDATITDSAGNTSIIQSSGTDILKNIDANSPTISTITSDAAFNGTLKVGDTISFTLTPGSAEAGATIIATYNTQSLIWSTANNGNTYTATYTVSEGEPDQIVPLQISNVTITDSAGNTSIIQSSGTDILKNIDANSPTISTITSDAASNGTLKVGDTISFTLTPGSAEAGATIIATYNAQSLIWSTANNGNTYTATYTVSEGEPDQIVPLQISNVTITDSAGNTSIQSSGTDILKNIDANSPTITSITSDATTSGTLKVGDTISFTLTPGSAEAGATIIATYNAQSLIWSTANNGNTYTATYTVSEGDADQTALQITDATITDSAGNTSIQSSGTDILKNIDANSPTISTITSDAAFNGTLKVDDTISFTLTPGSAEAGATIIATYNAQSLIWSTANNGNTYTATYTVSEGDADQIVPLQISNVTITDSAGNTSLPFNGTDIVKAIDANSPTISTITSDAVSNGTLKVGDTISFTLTPGSAEIGNTVNGTYNTQSLIWSTANNGNTYTATYTVSEGEPDQIVPLQISNVTITDSAGNTSIIQSSGTDILKNIDANSPTISTITSDAVSNGTLKVGDTISFTLTPGSAEAGATIIATYNTQSLIWSTANNGNTYTATYTVSEGEPDQIVPLQISNVTITDSAGNTSIIQSSGTDILKNIDANSPTITSITSDATTSGTLKVGDTISFTLTPGSAEAGATIFATYNTQSLIWSTANNGNTYTATYTVSEGEPDQIAIISEAEGLPGIIPLLQITNVTITDSAGNTSLPFNGTDIVKAIDANSPTISTITSDAVSNGTLKVGDTISFTLTPGSAETEATIIATYNTQSLIWSAVNNGTTYTATYTVSEGDADQIVSLQISNVTITDSAGNTSLPFNGTDIVKAIDANSPTISTITSDAAFNGTLKVDDTISFTLTPGSAEAGATIIATYNAQSLIWSTTNNSTTYTATYTVSEGDADQIVPLQISNVTITDSAGNTSLPFNGTDIVKAIDANSPTISTITSDAAFNGTLKVGDTISFTLTPGSAEIGNTVNGTYNTQSLIWSTANNGTTYTATYTVSEGDADQIVPLQISNVTITDSAGNTSIIQSSGTDILKTIDANSPTITSITSDATTFDTLKVGDTISFTLTPGSAEVGNTVNGTYNTQSLIWSTANNGTTYTATYTVSEGEPDQIEIIPEAEGQPGLISLLQITNVTITDSAGNTSLPFNGTDIVKNIDANSPTISTITSDAVSNGTLKVGDTISFTLTPGSAETGATIFATYNTQSLIWSAANNDTTYTATYTVSEGDADQIVPLQISNVTITDSAGNTSIIQSSGTDILKTIDANSPTISTITSDATTSGTLKVGDTISFTLTPGSAETGNTVNGTYSTQSLIWSTANNGTTYTATYTVSEGEPDQIVPLQISNVTITDSAGNTSFPENGIDVQKTVDANYPKFLSSVLNEETSIFMITFDETINVSTINSTGLSIRDDDTGTSAVTLSASELIPVINGVTISFNITQAKLASIVAFTTSVLDIDTGAVRDISGNPITMSTNNTITTIADTISPIITLTGANTQTLELGDGYTELGATTDDGSPITINSAEFTDVVGTYSIYYDSADASGNIAIQVVRTVIVNDSTPPDPCVIPDSGDWIITDSCTLDADATALGSVIVQNGSVLNIPSGITLDIDFATFNLTVQSGGGVLIKSGGTLT